MPGHGDPGDLEMLRAPGTQGGSRAGGRWRVCVWGLGEVLGSGARAQGLEEFLWGA